MLPSGGLTGGKRTGTCTIKNGQHSERMAGRHHKIGRMLQDLPGSNPAAWTAVAN